MSVPASRQQLPFTVVMRGYDREQVADRLRRIDAEMRVLAADRDAATANARELAAHLQDAREEIEDLRREVDKLSVPPTTAQGMSERLSRMLQLASDEASEMRAEASSEAAETVSVARQEADDLQRNAADEADRIIREATEKAAAIVADADAYQRDTRCRIDAAEAQSKADTEQATRQRAQRASAMEAEHENTMAAARAEADRIVALARSKADELETGTAQTLAAERERHDAELADFRARTEEHADAITATAHEIAAERLARARDLGSRVSTARDEILAEFARIQETMAGLPSILTTEVDRELTTASETGDTELLNQELSERARIRDSRRP
ncbi:hypothetical protein [Gordonia sp. NPDC003376]